MANLWNKGREIVGEGALFFLLSFLSLSGFISLSFRVYLSLLGFISCLNNNLFYAYFMGHLICPFFLLQNKNVNTLLLIFICFIFFFLKTRPIWAN